MARPEVEKVAVPLLSVEIPISVPLSVNVTVPVAADCETWAVNVTVSPAVEEEGLAENVVVVLILFTVSVCAEEVLAACVESPLYEAVSESEPAGSAVVSKIARPPLRFADPSRVEPSKNLTDPVELCGDTLAVNETDCPKVDVLGLSERVVVVLVNTTWDTLADVLAASFGSPLYVAFSESVPGARLEVDNCASPPESVAVPSEVLPLKNCTEPVAVDGDTLALSVTADPETDGLGLLVSVVAVVALFTVSETALELLAV